MSEVRRRLTPQAGRSRAGLAGWQPGGGGAKGRAGARRPLLTREELREGNGGGAGGDGARRLVTQVVLVGKAGGRAAAALAASAPAAAQPSSGQQGRVPRCRPTPGTPGLAKPHHLAPDGHSGEVDEHCDGAPRGRLACGRSADFRRALRGGIRSGARRRQQPGPPGRVARCARLCAGRGAAAGALASAAMENCAVAPGGTGSGVRSTLLTFKLPTPQVFHSNAAHVRADSRASRAAKRGALISRRCDLGTRGGHFESLFLSRVYTGPIIAQ